MKKLLLLILPLLAITFNSCSKDDGGDDNGGGNSKLVKRITVEGDYTLDLTYDGQQRITKMVWKDIDDDGAGSITTLTYANNKVTISWSDEGDEVFTLDNNGYVTREDYSNSNYQTHTYSNGYLTKTAWDFDD